VTREPSDKLFRFAINAAKHRRPLPDNSEELPSALNNRMVAVRSLSP
jgi:hypothetical protein